MSTATNKQTDTTQNPASDDKTLSTAAPRSTSASKSSAAKSNATAKPSTVTKPSTEVSAKSDTAAQKTTVAKASTPKKPASTSKNNTAVKKATVAKATPATKKGGMNKISPTTKKTVISKPQSVASSSTALINVIDDGSMELLAATLDEILAAVADPTNDQLEQVHRKATQVIQQAQTERSSTSRQRQNLVAAATLGGTLGMLVGLLLAQTKKS